jgi:hypothetical protein
MACARARAMRAAGAMCSQAAPSVVLVSALSGLVCACTPGDTPPQTPINVSPPPQRGPGLEPQAPPQPNIPSTTGAELSRAPAWSPKVCDPLDDGAGCLPIVEPAPSVPVWEGDSGRR